MCPGGKSKEEKKAAAREARIARMLDAQIQQDELDEEAVLKLLLLGAGESGKSTVFKQMQALFGKGFTEDDRLSYVSVIHGQVIAGVKMLARQSMVLPVELQTRVDPSVEASRDYVLNELRGDAEVTPDVARHVSALWADDGIRHTYKARSRFQLSDMCRFFFEKVDEVADPAYVPTLQDVLNCRARTTGIVETSFEIEGNRFMMVDVGGQRNERKKWIHCFEGVTAVIFVAAINEYDQVLYEDGRTNRVDEALNLFAEICNSRWFRETSMILFLNKRDLFAEKIRDGIEMRGASPAFDAYEGGDDVEMAIDYMTDLFVGLNDYPESREIYVHVTEATDTSNIAFTFNVVKDVILRTRLRECGLLE